MSLGAYPLGTAPLGTSGSSNYSNVITDIANATNQFSLGTFALVTDNGVAHGTVDLALLVANMLETVGAHDATSLKSNLHESPIDHANASTALLVAFSVLATTTGNATATPTTTYGQISQLVDTLIAHDLVATVMDAKAVVIEAAMARDAMLRTFPVSLSDNALGTNLATTLLAAHIAFVDNAVAHSATNFAANITVALKETAIAHDTLLTAMAMHELIVDGARAVVTFSLNGNVFTGVVLNAESSGVSEYTNFPFNSFAFFGGQYYGGADDGIYALAGDTDNGTPITARVRTGLHRMNDGLRTRMPYAYFGLTTTGDMLVKVITTSPEGSKQENWYRLEKRTADATRETRVKIGRGLSSVYWGAELVNVNGADFALDSVQWWPLSLDRRV